MEYMKRLALFLAALTLACASCTNPDESDCATPEEREAMCHEAFMRGQDTWTTCHGNDFSMIDTTVLNDLASYEGQCIYSNLGVECLPYSVLTACFNVLWSCNDNNSDLIIPEECSLDIIMEGEK